MNWFVWRQSRKSFLILGLFLAIYATVAIPTGIHFWHVYQQMLADCKLNPANPTCTGLSTSSLFPTVTDRLLVGLIPSTVLFLPITLGVFWGAPLLAKEYAEGTNSLVWTQSVSRRKWLSIKLVWTLMATALFMTAFAALVTWWLRPSNALDVDRFSNGNVFGIEGMVPVAVSLFAVSYGILFGAWFKKVMVAVGITLALFVIVAHIVVPNLLRPNYAKPITVTSPMGPKYANANIPTGAWVTSQIIHNGSGHAVVGDIFPAAPPQCQKVIQEQSGPAPNGSGIAIKIRAGSGDPIDACLNSAGWHQVSTYQPSYRYWDFQRIETGIYLGLTALAVGATYWLVLKRDA